jgi:hypothetical protein
MSLLQLSEKSGWCMLLEPFHFRLMYLGMEEMTDRPMLL